MNPRHTVAYQSHTIAQRGNTRPSRGSHFGLTDNALQELLWQHNRPLGRILETIRHVFLDHRVGAP